MLRLIARPLVFFLELAFNVVWILERLAKAATRGLRRLASAAYRPVRWAAVRPARSALEKLGYLPPAPPQAALDRVTSAIQTFDMQELEDATRSLLEGFVVPTVHRYMLRSADRRERRRLRSLTPDKLAEEIFRACDEGTSCFPPMPPESRPALALAVKRHVNGA